MHILILKYVEGFLIPYDKDSYAITSIKFTTYIIFSELQWYTAAKPMHFLTTSPTTSIWWALTLPNTSNPY